MPAPSEVCDYLKPRLTNFSDVRPAKGLEPDAGDTVQVPVLLVHPVTELADPNRYDNFVAQTVAEQFACITVCAIGDLKARRDELFAALHGQLLPDYSFAVTFLSGDTFHIEASVIWWKDQFQVIRDRRQS